MSTASSRAIRLACFLLVGVAFVSLFALALFLTGPPAAYAGPIISSTWYVNPVGSDTNACTGSGISACQTIAGAVGKATSTGGTINIAAGTYAEHVIVGSKSLTFIGAGASSTFVDGSNTGRVFSVTATSATFSNLTIQKGKVTGDSGGGIYAAGALTLNNVNVLTNTVDAGSTTSQGGGGVRVRGVLRVTGGRFQNNLATGATTVEGGAIFSNAPTTPHPNVSVSGATFSGNSASYGGGISLAADVWLTNTQFITNSATSRGGGVFSSAGGTLTLSGGRFESNSAGSGGRGGGVYYAGAAVMNGTEFFSNTTLGTGGGARIGGAVTLADTEFTGNSATGGQGGGLYAGNTVKVTNGTFTDNDSSSTGGGLYVASTATVTGTQFISNTSTSSGGGLYVASTATVTGTQFISNTAASGGGLYAHGVATLVDAQFTSNDSPNGSGGGARIDGAATVTGANFISNTAGGSGGGLYTSAATMTGSTFTGNMAGASGGGVYTSGPLTLRDTTFSRNSSAGVTTGGGGAYAGQTATVDDTQFSDNTATSGGGLYVGGGAVGNTQVANALFAGNSATTNGAALYLTAAAAGRTATILHTTIGSPSLGAAQAIYVGGTSGVTTDIKNTIITGYVVGIQQAAGTVTAQNTLFHGNTTDIGGTVTNNAPVYADPLFVDPANGAYHLGPDSPAVDAGIDAGVTTDYDGDTRPQGYGYDIGYDEVLQRRVLATGTNYLFASPTITLTFSGLGNVYWAAVVYFPHGHAHATGTVGHGVGADHFWQIAARDSSGVAATGFTAKVTAPTGGFSEPALCFYPDVLGGDGWACTGSVDNGDGTVSLTTTHFSDWAVGNEVPTAITLQTLRAGSAGRAGALPGLALIASLIAGGGVWLFTRRAVRQR